MNAAGPRSSREISIGGSLKVIGTSNASADDPPVIGCGVLLTGITAGCCVAHPVKTSPNMNKNVFRTPIHSQTGCHALDAIAFAFSALILDITDVEEKSR
jgi:hypothetical protein